jgi:hypothetical protein
MKDTVFTNSEVGKLLQKYWLQEFQKVLSKNYNEQEHDYILVVPDGQSDQARTMFMDIKSDGMPICEIRNRIHEYVNKNKKQGKIVVIFLNPECRISYYTIYGLKSKI